MSCYAGAGAKIACVFRWEGLGVGVGVNAIYLFISCWRRSSTPHYRRHLASFSVKVTYTISIFSFSSLQDFHDYKEKLYIPAGDCLFGSMAHSSFLKYFYYTGYLFSKLGVFSLNLDKFLVILTQNIPVWNMTSWLWKKSMWWLFPYNNFLKMCWSVLIIHQQLPSDPFYFCHW